MEYILNLYWRLEFKIKEVIYNFKMAYLRVTRGYDNSAIWGFDEHIAIEIKEICFNLADNHWGYPSAFKGMTDKEWTQILLDISFGFGSYLEMRSGVYTFEDKEFKNLEKEYKNGMKLFSKYHQYIWD